MDVGLLQTFFKILLVLNEEILLNEEDVSVILDG